MNNMNFLLDTLEDKIKELELSFINNNTINHAIKTDVILNDIKLIILYHKKNEPSVKITDIYIDMSVRLSNILLANEIHTIYDLSEYTKKSFLRLRNVGVTTLREATDLLSKYRLTWAV